MNTQTTHCKCGGILRMKNHQRWIGYYCPSCKSGGSIQKKPGRWTGNNSATNFRPKVEATPLTESRIRYETPSMKLLPTTPNPIHIIKLSQLSWHKNSNSFITEVSDLKAMNIEPIIIARKECFVLMNEKTNSKRNFFKDFDMRDAEGELQYTEYSNNINSNLKLRIYND